MSRLDSMKVFLDYIHIMTRLPELYDRLAEESGRQGAIPDASQQDEIEDLSRRVPRLIGILPNVLHGSRKIDDRHPAALEEMVKGLLGVVERANPLILVGIFPFFLADLLMQSTVVSNPATEHGGWSYQDKTCSRDGIYSLSAECWGLTYLLSTFVYTNISLFRQKNVF